MLRPSPDITESRWSSGWEAEAGTLLVGYSILRSLSSNDPEEGRTSLGESILQKEVNYLPHTLLDFWSSTEITLGWWNLWKGHGSISSQRDTPQSTNILASLFILGPAYASHSKM